MRLIIAVVTLGAIFALGYYMFFRRYEIRVKFTAKTIPGDVVETIRIWNRSLGDSRIIAVDSISRIEQEVAVGDRSYRYSWEIEQTTDSTLAISVGVVQPGQTIKNKLLIPFTTQPVEEDAERLVREFRSVLIEHLEITSVKIVGEADVEESFCICSLLKTAQIEKANGMMRDYVPLTSMIGKFGIKPAGFPSVRVTHWDHNAGTLEFNFCFPIDRSDTLPEVDNFKYQQFSKVKALKAEYHGNYITSDRAWYELLTFARQNGYEVTGLPIEFFHNNPNLGLMETEWQADIYLPVKKKN